MMKSGANRTLMLVVEAGTPGLPFECAQLVVSCFVLCALIYWLWLPHGFFTLVAGRSAEAGRVGWDVMKLGWPSCHARQAGLVRFLQQVADGQEKLG